MTTPTDPIAKTRARLQNIKHLDAKELALRHILPLMAAQEARITQALSNVDENFADIFGLLGFATDESEFLDKTGEMVEELSTFVDGLLLAAGFTSIDPETGEKTVTEKMPPEVAQAVQEWSARLMNWFNTLEVLKVAAADAAEDDDDDDFEEADFEEDEPVIERGPDAEPPVEDPREPVVQEATQEAPNG